MTDPVIALIRETTLLTDRFVQAIVPSLQTQIDRDFHPAWGLRADVVFVPGGSLIPAGAWQVHLLDNADQAGDLGYHTTTPEGWPLAKVFMDDILRDQVNWNVTVSHEVLEMIGDPHANKTVAVDGIDYALENCDPCEDDQFAYSIAGHFMSDFILPSWFDPTKPPPYDFREVLTQPLGLAVGGYIGYREAGGTWQQRLAAGEPGARTFKGPSSRTLTRFNRP